MRKLKRTLLKQIKWKKEREEKETGGLTIREKYEAKDHDEAMHFAMRG